MNLRDRLNHAVTQHDIKQAKRFGYNRYALAMYLAAVASAVEAVDMGTEPSTALAEFFLPGPLLNACLKVTK